MEEAGMSEEEDELIDSLFSRCDTQKEGRVHVHAVIQYLKTFLGNNNEPDLLTLAGDLEADSQDGKVPLDTYRQVLRHWILDIRQRRDSTSFLEPDGPLQHDLQHELDNSTDMSSFIESSVVSNEEVLAVDNVVALEGLRHEVEDLRFQNRRLSEEAATLQRQLEAQDETLMTRNKEEELLKKKIKSLQEVIELRQTVMEENEELKSKLLHLQDRRRDQDSRIVALEKENNALDGEFSQMETKWQKTCMELESAKKELQASQVACLEHKTQLLDEKVLKSSNEDLLEEKMGELTTLKEKCNYLTEQNQKLEEEKNGVQVTLAQMSGKLQRYQSRAEQLGLGDGSLVEEEQVILGPGTRLSPKLRFSTPLTKHSICMELKDRLNEDLHLPSPLCEKDELSHLVGRPSKSAVLPTYMSNWDLEMSNNSQQDYSLELLQNLNLPQPEGLEIDKKLAALKDLKRDDLHREIIKLYRVNLDLAEKCHIAELKEKEWQERLTEKLHQSDIEKLRLQLSQASVEPGAQIDVKDLWRLVHSVHETSTESEGSPSGPEGLSQPQIERQVQELRRRLDTKDLALGSLKSEHSRLLKCFGKGRASLSPLIEALDIDTAKVKRRQNSARADRPSISNRPCQCPDSIHQCNQSAPVLRKHKPGNDNNGKNTNQDSIKYESVTSPGESDTFETQNKSDKSETSGADNKMRKCYNIPKRFRPDSMVSSGSSEEGCFQFEVISDSDHPPSSSSTSDDEMSYPTRSRFSVDYGQSFELKYDSQFPNPEQSIQAMERALLRRDSYKAAISLPGHEDKGSEHSENSDSERIDLRLDFQYKSARERFHDLTKDPIFNSSSCNSGGLSKAGSVDDTCDRISNESARPHRQNSFKTAIEEGHVTPDSLSTGTPSMSVEDDMVPEFTSSESLSIHSAPKPKYSSTPLPMGVKQGTVPSDTQHTQMFESQGSHNENARNPSTDLFKTGAVNINRLSPVVSSNLSALPEEDLDTSSGKSTDPITKLTSQTSNVTSPIQNFTGTGSSLTSSTDQDCSAVVWTLSDGEGENLRGTSDILIESCQSSGSDQSNDSGHSSSLESFQKSLLPNSSTDDNENDNSDDTKPDTHVAPVSTDQVTSAPPSVAGTGSNHRKPLAHGTACVILLETALDSFSPPYSIFPAANTFTSTAITATRPSRGISAASTTATKSCIGASAQSCNLQCVTRTTQLSVCTNSLPSESTQNSALVVMASQPYLSQSNVLQPKVNQPNVSQANVCTTNFSCGQKSSPIYSMVTKHALCDVSDQNQSKVQTDMPKPSFVVSASDQHLAAKDNQVDNVCVPTSCVSCHVKPVQSNTFTVASQSDHPVHNIANLTNFSSKDREVKNSDVISNETYCVHKQNASATSSNDSGCSAKSDSLQETTDLVLNSVSNSVDNPRSKVRSLLQAQNVNDSMACYLKSNQRLSLNQCKPVSVRSCTDIPNTEVSHKLGAYNNTFIISSSKAANIAIASSTSKSDTKVSLPLPASPVSKQPFTSVSPRSKSDLTRGRPSNKYSQHDYYSARNLSPSERILMRSGERARPKSWDSASGSPFRCVSSPDGSVRTGSSVSLNDSFIVSMEKLDLSESVISTDLSSRSSVENKDLSDGDLEMKPVEHVNSSNEPAGSDSSKVTPTNSTFTKTEERMVSESFHKTEPYSFCETGNNESNAVSGADSSVFEHSNSGEGINNNHECVYDGDRKLPTTGGLLRVDLKYSSVRKTVDSGSGDNDSFGVSGLETKKSHFLVPGVESKPRGRYSAWGIVEMEVEEKVSSSTDAPVSSWTNKRAALVQQPSDQASEKSGLPSPVGAGLAAPSSKMNGCDPVSRTKHVLISEEPGDHGDMDGDGDRPAVTSSYLSKIRENHLAKRRDFTRQNKMPLLSELAERGEARENNNNQPRKPATSPELNGQMADVIEPPEPSQDVIMPSIPDDFINKLGLNSSDSRSSEELSDQEIESKFTSLSLAFKTDSQTLEKRLEIQERSRDIAEQNVDKELQGLRTGLETLNQICTDPQVREVLSKIQNHIDILEKSTARVSSRAEVFGAIQQEKRMSKAVDIMVHHVENLRRVHEREHAELEEARKLLQDSRSLAPSTIDMPGGSDMLSRRSASVCQNNMFTGKLSPQVGTPTSLGPFTPTTAKAIKLLKASRRRVSEIALPKVLGGSGAATLHPSSSMDFSYMDPPRVLRSPTHVRSESSLEDMEGSNIHTAHIDSDSSLNSDSDARSRFQAAVAHTTVKSAVTNTLRRASLEKQSHVQSATPNNTPPQVSRDNSTDSAKVADAQDKEKQKNMEEEAFKKGYEQGLRAHLGQDLSSLREQQNHINESLGEIMDSIDNHMDEPQSLKEIMLQRFQENVPKIHISGWRIRMTMGCFFIIMAVLSIIMSLFPVSSAEHASYRHYGQSSV